MSAGRRVELPEAHVVDSADVFAEVCRCLGRADRMGFDAEFVAEDAFAADACLIQVATDEHIWLIDPLAGFDTGPFWEFVADEQIETVVHAGLEDLAMCYHQTHSVPRNVFDVQIAAGLVGLDYPMNLQRLARSLVGARLHKSQTLTNWRKRPLSPEQLRYAAEDVAYLLPIHTRLCERLGQRARMDWAREEFARFGDENLYQHQECELFRRVRGAGSLDRKGLAIVRELAIERQSLARQYDRPPRAVLKDHLIVAIARHGMSSPKELRSLRGISLRDDAIRRITAAVVRALEAPPDQWPKVMDLQEDTIQETTLRKLISAVLTDFCNAQGIAVQLLSTNKDVRALVLSHTRETCLLGSGALQRGWRKRVIGSLVDDVMSGRRSIRVVDGEGGPRLAIE